MWENVPRLVIVVLVTERVSVLMNLTNVVRIS